MYTNSHRHYTLARDGQSRYRRRRQRPPSREAPYSWSAGDSNPIAKIVDPENLLAAFEIVARYGGPAAGPDGISPADVTRSEIAAALRQVSRAVLNGEYRPGRPRRVNIPKLLGGFRSLDVFNLLDRIVAKATALAIERACDADLPDNIHGFRRGRSPWTMFAELERLVVQQEWQFACEVDVANAFPTTPISLAIVGLARSITSTELLAFVELLIRGHQGPARPRGLAQGCPISNFAFNAAMKTIFTNPIGDPEKVHRLQYADNHVFVSKTAAEGDRAVMLAEQSLQHADMGLKPHAGPVDLQEPGTQLEIMGVRVSRGTTGLRFAVGETAWNGLARDLREASGRENPPALAREIVLGWVTSYGPAFESVGDETIGRIDRVLAESGHREGPTHEEIDRAIGSGIASWEKVRTRHTNVVRPTLVTGGVGTITMVSTRSAPDAGEAPF